MWWRSTCNENNFVEIKLRTRKLGNQQVTVMNGIECSAEYRDLFHRV